MEIHLGIWHSMLSMVCWDVSFVNSRKSIASDGQGSNCFRLLGSELMYDGYPMVSY